MKQSKWIPGLVILALFASSCKKKAEKLEVDYAAELFKIMVVDEFIGGPSEILLGSKSLDYRLAVLLSACQTKVDSSFEVVTADKMHLTYYRQLTSRCTSGPQIDSVAINTEKTGYVRGDRVIYSGISRFYGNYNSLSSSDSIRIFKGQNTFEGLMKLDELKNSYSTNLEIVYTELRFHKVLKTIYSGSGLVKITLTDTNDRSARVFQGTFTLGSGGVLLTLDGAQYNIAY